MDLTKNGPFAPSAVIVQTTEALRELTSAGCAAMLLPAFIDLSRAKSAAVVPRKYITMFNPVEAKGGFLFREIVQRMPERPFAIVPGWCSLRNDAGVFDPRKMQRVFQSKGLEYNGALPLEPDFSALKNVSVLAPREKVSEIYDLTRILLVPSQWKEQFGRVIFEAAANGAAVIASGIESLRENAGDAALFVNDYANVDEWINAIRSLDDKEVYASQCNKGKEFVAQTYSLERAVEQFHNVLWTVSMKGNYPNRYRRWVVGQVRRVAKAIRGEMRRRGVSSQ
jgi:hypothetical protein